MVKFTSYREIKSYDVVTASPLVYTFYRLNMTQYYVETDGKLFLIKRNNSWGFPSSRDRLPFDISPRAKMVVGDEEVIYCEPDLPRHPKDWFNKEDVPLLDDVDAIVRKAVNYSLPRIVVEAVVRRSGKVLLVKPSRGYNEDSWTLPGGFLVYSETPRSAVKREVKEEVNVEPIITDLLDVYSARGTRNSYQWIIFYYAAELTGSADDIQPNHEIKELKWFESERAAEVINSTLMRKGFERVISQDQSD